MNDRAKEWGLSFQVFYDRYMFLIVPASMMLGFLFYPWLSGLTEAVPYLFAYMTFVMALGCSRNQMKAAMMQPVPMLLTFAAVHIAAPLIAYGMGLLIFGSGSPYIIGMVLFTIIPLGVSSVIWIGFNSGNVPLTLAMILLDSSLSPFVVPLEISLFFGTDIDFDYWSVMKDLLIIIVVPTIIGIAVNEWSKGRAKFVSQPVTGPTSKLAFTVIILINAAAVAPHVIELKQDMLLVLLTVIVLVAICYLIGYIVSLAFRQKELTITLTYSSGMRNISLGVVIGLAYFEPSAAVPVVLSILIQQPMATLVHWVFQRVLYKKLTSENG